MAKPVHLSYAHAMANIRLRKKKNLSIFRRLSLGTWRTEYDPQVYGSVEIRMDKALEYMTRFREKTGKRLTITHMVGKAVAACLESMPGANAILRFKRLYVRDSIGLCFSVAMVEEDGKKIDLSAAKVDHVDKLSLAELVDALDEQVSKVRDHSDPVLEKTRSSFRFVPVWFTHTLLNIIGFFSYTLNWDMRWAGIPKDPFGSAMITNIGSLGLESAYVPLIPYSRCPLILAVGAVRDEAVVDDGKVVPGKVMRIFATFDHRIMDGVHAARMSQLLRDWMEKPFEHFDPVD